MAMKAIPMKGRLKGKRIYGFIWAGEGSAWTRKENYFQLEHGKLVTASFVTPSGSFRIRCRGATCEIRLRGPKDEVLSTLVLSLPHGRKR